MQVEFQNLLSVVMEWQMFLLLSFIVICTNKDTSQHTKINLIQLIKIMKLVQYSNTINKRD